jgi:hypothetical protein
MMAAERRRNRTYQPPGYDGLPVLKTGWGTSPVPLRRAGYVGGRMQFAPSCAAPGKIALLWQP